MNVTIARTATSQVDIAGYHSVSVVAPASSTPGRKSRPARRTRTTRHRRRVDVDGMVEISVVRSSRNRLGGGARARPAQAL
jgi:hypothetical protein